MADVLASVVVLPECETEVIDMLLGVEYDGNTTAPSCACTGYAKPDLYELCVLLATTRTSLDSSRAHAPANNAQSSSIVLESFCSTEWMIR